MDTRYKKTFKKSINKKQKDKKKEKHIKTKKAQERRKGQSGWRADLQTALKRKGRFACAASITASSAAR